MRTTKWGLLLCAVVATQSTSGAHSREFGVPPSVPAGNTMAAPIAFPPPPGFYFNVFSGYLDGSLKGGSGETMGQTNGVFNATTQFMWVPDFEVFGGTYRASISVPFVNIDQTRKAPFPNPFQWGSETDFGVGNIGFSPLNLSWQIEPGIFFSSGFTVFAPIGDFDPNKAINTGGDFWTFAPEVGFSYLRDGWNLSLNATYFLNTESASTDYRSGDEVLVNATAMKDIGSWSLGPVGYYRKQVTEDDNNGFAYGGLTAGRAEQLGLGLGVTKRFGPLNVNVNLTKDVYVRDTVGGTKLWLNLILPLGAKPPAP